MTRALRTRLGGLLACLVLLVGPAAAQQPQSLPTTGLSIVTAAGQTFQFDVEVALTRQEQATGLMFRENMPANAGMLFLLDRVRPASFWMRNTLISLDMLFLHPDGTIESIARRTVPLSEQAVPSKGPVAAVLELNGGLTALLGIAAGDRVVHERLAD